MDSKQILKADLLDLVFDNRNKDYGAYELRRYYNRRITKALTFTGALVAITFTSIAIVNNQKDIDLTNPKETPAVIVRTITEDPPEPVIPQQPKPQPAAQPVRSEIFVNPVVTRNEDVTEPMADQETLSQARISNVYSEGTVDQGIPTELPVGDNTGIIQQKEEKNDEPFTRVEIEAKYDGNWEKFLRRNLNPDLPANNGAPAGRYPVLIQFVVDIDGSVSDIRPLTVLGYGMEEEAMRVLKKATNWKPAFQNGNHVKAYRRQMITFVVDEY